MQRTTLLVLLVVVGCQRKESPPAPPTNPAGPKNHVQSLAEARKGFTTRLARQVSAGEPVPEPPARVFREVRYDSPVGPLAAYLTPDPKDGKKRPAIIWITGGDCNTIGDVWTPPGAKNDQSARQYREAGIVMMFPSLRGGNDNPSFQENFYGEVDDVIAAADFLSQQDYVDTKRIYLGGHSTGGTLVMLVAACSDSFRAVFSFGPADDISGYPAQLIPAVSKSDRHEVELRSPGNWLHSIQSPTFVFEGTDGGNLSSLEAMRRASTNPKVTFHAVNGADHFSLLAPANQLIARRILRDTGSVTNLAFNAAELSRLFEK
jgi:dipeptidyl aminopeptidase/acylaminoacyl peptidase